MGDLFKSIPIGEDPGIWKSEHVAAEMKTENILILFELNKPMTI
jgi:hypothetical protein